MKVTLIQNDVIWASPKENHERLDRIFSEIPKSDLIVLPEMFSTGFVVRPEGVAEKLPNPVSLQWMKDRASALGSAIAGSVAVEENGQYYNRFYFVKPDSEVISYDKRHLFTFGGEDKTFTAGDKRVIVEWKGVRFLLLICYDLRFPVWARNRKDYDAIIIVASWPKVRRYAWDTLLKARAIENQCYVLSVDRIGDDADGNHYNGGTFFIDPLGKVLEEAVDTEDGAIYQSITFDMDTKQLEEKFRPTFPVLNDADDFKIVL